MIYSVNTMLRAALCIALSFSTYSACAQTDNARKSKCPREEVELVAGNQIPDGFSIVGTSSMARLEHHTQLDRLAGDEQDVMRTLGKQKSVCAVFVDFEGIVPIAEHKGPSHESHLVFYALKYAQ